MDRQSFIAFKCKINWNNWKEAEELLGEIGIIVNKNTIPNETESPFRASGIRLGTASITTRGFDEKDSQEVANIIVDLLKNKKDKEELRSRVKALTEKYPLDMYEVRV